MFSSRLGLVTSICRGTTSTLQTWAGGLPVRGPLAVSHVHGDHIVAPLCGWSHLCHLEQQLPAECAHSPGVRGEGLVLGMLYAAGGGGHGAGRGYGQRYPRRYGRRYTR